MKVKNKHLISETVEALERAQELLLNIIRVDDTELGSDVDLYDQVNNVILNLEDLKQ